MLSINVSSAAESKVLPRQPAGAFWASVASGRTAACNLISTSRDSTGPAVPSGIGPGVADLAQRAEAIGVRTLSFMDHFFQMDWMAPAEDPMLEGYTALGFVAGRTERLRLRLLVTGVTYRHPGLLAKTVTTLDVVSGGRAELGIGAAWYEREHRGLGVPFPPTAERFERLEEAIQICLQMWSDDNGAVPRASTTGSTRRSAARCRSARPGPRILIGGERRAEDAPARRAVRATRATSSAGPRRSRTSSTCCAATATPWAATRTRSRSPRCTATCPPDATVDDVVRGAEAFAEGRRVDARHRRRRRRPRAAGSSRRSALRWIASPPSRPAPL